MDLTLLSLCIKVFEFKFSLIHIHNPPSLFDRVAMSYI